MRFINKTKQFFTREEFPLILGEPIIFNFSLFSLCSIPFPFRSIFFIPFQKLWIEHQLFESQRLPSFFVFNDSNSLFLSKIPFSLGLLSVTRRQLKFLQGYLKYIYHIISIEIYFVAFSPFIKLIYLLINQSIYFYQSYLSLE